VAVIAAHSPVVDTVHLEWVRMSLCAPADDPERFLAHRSRLPACETLGRTAASASPKWRT